MIFALYIFAYVDCKVKTNDSFLFRCSRLIITEEISICLVLNKTLLLSSSRLRLGQWTAKPIANIFLYFSIQQYLFISPPVHHIQNLIQTGRIGLVFKSKSFIEHFSLYLWLKSVPTILIFNLDDEPQQSLETGEILHLSLCLKTSALSKLLDD